MPKNNDRKLSQAIQKDERIQFFSDGKSRIFRSANIYLSGIRVNFKASAGLQIYRSRHGYPADRVEAADRCRSPLQASSGLPSGDNLLFGN
jgi:hypothetical protein